MRILVVLCVFLLALISASSSCTSGKKVTYRVGIDSNWYPLNLDAFQPYVNGYTDDLLLEISRYTGIEWVRLDAPWDALLDGLNSKKYDAVLTSLPSYNFNLAKYDFSKNFLDLGPVLIIPVNAHSHDLTKLSNEVVGVVKGDPAVLLLQKYPEIIVRKYNTVPDLLNAVATGSLEGALLDRLAACGYVRDLYAGRLKISSESLTDAGLHLASPKGQQKHLIELFDQTLLQLKKQKKLKALQKKWQLYTQAA